MKVLSGSELPMRKKIGVQQLYQGLVKCYQPNPTAGPCLQAGAIILELGYKGVRRVKENPFRWGWQNTRVILPSTL